MGLQTDISIISLLHTSNWKQRQPFLHLQLAFDKEGAKQILRANFVGRPGSIYIKHFPKTTDTHADMSKFHN